MAFKMKNPSVAKMAKMAGDNRSAAKFNAGLRKASAEGKLDNNPKFKDAVDSAPMKKRTVTKTTDEKGNTTKTVTKTGISKPRSKFMNINYKMRDKDLYDAKGDRVDRKDFVKKIKTKTKDASGKRLSKSKSKAVKFGTSEYAAGTKQRKGYYGTDATVGSTRTVKGRGLKAEVTRRNSPSKSPETRTRGENIKRDFKIAGKVAQSIANIPGDIARGVIGEIKRNNAANRAKGDAKRAAAKK